MERILTLLKERNHYFKKFKSINSAELIRVSNNDFSHIDIFYKSRENILDMVANIEDLIEKRIAVEAPEEEVSREMKIDLMKVLREKDNLVKEILAQDLELISLIEVEKSKIITDLKALNKGRKALNAYQHGAAAPRLDEEL